MAEYRTSIHKDKIVIVDNDQWPNNPMFIWDPNSNHLKNIGSFSNLWLWHVEADENMLVAFEIDWDTSIRSTADQVDIDWTITRQNTSPPIAAGQSYRQEAYQDIVQWRASLLWPQDNEASGYQKRSETYHNGPHV